jgi:hypothetical protein
MGFKKLDNNIAVGNTAIVRVIFDIFKRFLSNE